MHEDTYRVRSFWQRRDGLPSDPETYWGDLTETVTVVDAMLDRASATGNAARILLRVEIAPLSELSLADLIGNQLTLWE